MKKDSGKIAVRKKEHLELCSTDDVAFKEKGNGFEKYDFLHFASTEVELNKIVLSKEFLGKEVAYPFLISCMTGGSDEADNINLQLAEAASALNIPLGIGSQRFALDEESSSYNRLKKIRASAPNLPILGNIGAAQVANGITKQQFRLLAELVEADAMVIHLNPLQELLQKEGQPNFYGLLKNTELLVKKTEIPIIIKEVGSGISKEVAKSFLDIGVKGIDVAGAGGTSWSGVEILRNKKSNDYNFWDWGLPTSFCIKKVASLKKHHEFILIGSGGINNSFDAAKALALGADFIGSARIVFHELNKRGVNGVVKMINYWFDDIKKIMFLTGSASLEEFDKTKLIKTEELF